MHCKPVKWNKVEEGGLWRSGWNTAPQGTRSFTAQGGKSDNLQRKGGAWLTSVPIMVFPGQLTFQPLFQECDQKSLLEPTQPWIHQINMGWMQGKICTWFFNSLLLRLSRVIMLTYKTTVWYDRVNIELTHRTSELLSCDSVQTAASERVLYLSSWHCLTNQLRWQCRHCRAGHDHKAHGCKNHA